MPQNFKYHLHNRTLRFFLSSSKYICSINQVERYSETYRISNSQLARIKYQRGQSWRCAGPFPSFQAIARAQPPFLHNRLSISFPSSLSSLQPWRYLPATLSMYDANDRTKLYFRNFWKTREELFTSRGLITFISFDISMEWSVKCKIIRAQMSEFHVSVTTVTIQ